ncbi:MAG: hypothetical protein HY553_06800, partial [Elusimicrobia bacterium]|nr:hypothetical protein [Elusimicrobiota bacterium]
MRAVVLTLALSNAAVAHAQTVRVAAPSGAPAGAGVAGAVPGMPAGANTFLPGMTLSPSQGTAPAPVRVMFSPLMGDRTLPADGSRAGAAAPWVRAGARPVTQTGAPATPGAAFRTPSRREVVPPELGPLAQSAVASDLRHQSRAVSNGAVPAAAA